MWNYSSYCIKNSLFECPCRKAESGTFPPSMSFNVCVLCRHWLNHERHHGYKVTQWEARVRPSLNEINRGHFAHGSQPRHHSLSRHKRKRKIPDHFWAETVCVAGDSTESWQREAAGASREGEACAITIIPAGSPTPPPPVLPLLLFLLGGSFCERQEKKRLIRTAFYRLAIKDQCPSWEIEARTAFLERWPTPRYIRGRNRCKVSSLGSSTSRPQKVAVCVASPAVQVTTLVVSHGGSSAFGVRQQF